MAVERVLCVNKSLLPNFYGVISLEQALWHKILANSEFVLRDEAEVSTTYKQIIPYCALFHNNKVFSYRRSAKVKEERLKQMWSIGIGGHINPIDTVQTVNIKEEIVFSCILREIKEEVGLEISESNIEFLALLNDDTNSVGKVHVGIVCVVVVSDDWINKMQLENTIDVYRWVDLRDVDFDKYESWSVLMARYLHSYGKEYSLELA